MHSGECLGSDVLFENVHSHVNSHELPRPWIELPGEVLVKIRVIKLPLEGSLSLREHLAEHTHHFQIAIVDRDRENGKAGRQPVLRAYASHIRQIAPLKEVEVARGIRSNWCLPTRQRLFQRGMPALPPSIASGLGIAREVLGTCGTLVRVQALAVCS